MTANEFVPQSMFEQISVYVDQDHAGCALTRMWYDGTRDDAWKALCETRAQCPVFDRVSQRRLWMGAAWHEVVQQDFGCKRVLCDCGV